METYPARRTRSLRPDGTHEGQGETQWCPDDRRQQRLDFNDDITAKNGKRVNSTFNNYCFFDWLELSAQLGYTLYFGCRERDFILKPLPQNSQWTDFLIYANYMQQPISNSKYSMLYHARNAIGSNFYTVLAPRTSCVITQQKLL